MAGIILAYYTLAGAAKQPNRTCFFLAALCGSVIVHSVVRIGFAEI